MHIPLRNLITAKTVTFGDQLEATPKIEAPIQPIKNQVKNFIEYLPDF